MVQDTLSDMLTQIRNANTVGMATVSLPSTRLNREMACLLVQEGFIASWKDYPAECLLLRLKYRPDRTPYLTSLRRISRPGCRVYVNHKEIPQVLGGMGIAILSTSQGLMTDRIARGYRVGGEVLCYIW
uniref:Small ribosomal subunit protein uS8c n=1 Tax=Nephroselmis pyriformis TaxID=156128 RepID=A0A8A2H8L3_9CHLO|nr:ribosomal protein S8 [Nephroselmis pyriformis]QSV37287.1 ribosomal protein S8 [Nephroselmis pyriformis]